MEQTQEDLENIKKKLIEHINKTYDTEKAEQFMAKISQMDDTAFIEFLKQQGLLKEDGSPVEQQQTKCIFCSLVFGEMPSTKIGENEKAISILELNPITKGHALVVPKEHIESEEGMPVEAKVLADQITEKIRSVYSPNRIDLISSNVMGHQIINILPIYNNETIDSPRNKQTPEGLAELKKEIDSAPEQIEMPEAKVEEVVEEKPEEKINEENTWLPKRMP